MYFRANLITIMKLSTFALLCLLGTFSLKASHNQGAFFNYQVTHLNQGYRVDVELHLFEAMSPLGTKFGNSFRVTGFGDFFIYKIDSIQRPQGDSLCPSGYLWEYVYRGSTNWSRVVPASGVTANIAITCCRVDGENLIDTLALSTNISFHVGSYRLNPPSLGIYLPKACNITADLGILKFARTDHHTILDFSVDSIPSDMDSVKYRLVPVYSDVGIANIYESGYSFFTPLPDKSEDTLNAYNIFDERQGTLSFKANGATTIEGLYFVSVAYDYYRDGFIVTTAYSYGVVNLSLGDSLLSSSLRLEALTKDSSYVLQDNDELEFTLFYGDSLNLGFKSYTTGGFGMTAGRLKGLTDTIGMGPGLAQPYLYKDQNSALGDTSITWFRWNPNLADFAQRPGTYKFKIPFAGDSCGSGSMLTNVTIHLRRSPSLSWRDTINACIGEELTLTRHFSGPGYSFGPANWFHYTNLDTVRLFAFQSGYVYLYDSAGVARDSAYLNAQFHSAPLPLNANAQLTQFTITEPPTSRSQLWTINSLVPLNGDSEDLVKIVGAGKYSALSYLPSDPCAYPTDTVRIEYDFTWGANYDETGPENRQISKTAGRLGEYYQQRISVNQDSRVIEKIFIQGLINRTSSPRLVFVELETSDGWVRNLSYSLPSGQSYIEVPEEIMLNPGKTLDIRVSLVSFLQMNLVEGSGGSFSIGGLTFSDFEKDQRHFAPIGITSTNYRVPIGIRYKGTIGVEEATLNTVSVYPNPANTYLWIDHENYKEITWTIWSITGRPIKTGSLNEDHQKVSLLDLSPGVYQIEIDGRFFKLVKL